MKPAMSAEARAARASAVIAAIRSKSLIKSTMLVSRDETVPRGHVLTPEERSKGARASLGKRTSYAGSKTQTFRVPKTPAQRSAAYRARRSALAEVPLGSPEALRDLLDIDPSPELWGRIAQRAPSATLCTA